MAFTDLTLDSPPRFDQAETEVPRWAFLERHRLLLTTLIPIAGLAAVTANSLIGYDTDHGFQVHHEGWFGANTANGGADKASHLTHLPGSTYTHDVYSADFKISGLARRLGVNLGPLRWLLLSVTYGTKGYRVSPPIEHQRQLGFEVGLNIQQILNDLGVKRNTWWGYSLHLFGDYIRFPFTAVGMRYDLNHGKWHGPNSGNYD